MFRLLVRIIGVIDNGAVSILERRAAFVGLSVAALIATIVVAIGLYLEYERRELRVFKLAKTTPLNLGYALRATKYHRAPRKHIGSFLVVVGVLFEAVFGFGAFISANIRDIQAEQQIADLNHKTEEARLEERKLRVYNADLESVLLPRTATKWLDKLAPLKKFAGTSVIILAVPDLEALRLGADIADLLSTCGWPVSFNVQSLDLALATPDGLTMSWPIAGPAETLYSYLRDNTQVDPQPYSFPNTSKPAIPMPKWWPTSLTPPHPSVSEFIVVGMKPVYTKMMDKRWLEALPERSQQWFRSRQAPYVERYVQ
jgi:hypothetical protein